MGKVKVGESAPDVSLITVANEEVMLSSTWQNGRSTLLIFLRHLA